MILKAKETLIMLLLLVVILAACSGGGGSAVNLESMKKTVSNAGYKADDDFLKANEDIVGGFSVIYPRKNSEAYIPVYEMKDQTAAAAYAKLINEAGSNLALVNGKFLAVVSAAAGNEEEKAFFENLLNGRRLD